MLISGANGQRGANGEVSGQVYTRRIMVGVLITTALCRPVFGSMRLWSVKTMSSTTPGTVIHTAAEVVSILT